MVSIKIIGDGDLIVLFTIMFEDGVSCKYLSSDCNKLFIHYSRKNIESVKYRIT